MRGTGADTSSSLPFHAASPAPATLCSDAESEIGPSSHVCRPHDLLVSTRPRMCVAIVFCAAKKPAGAPATGLRSGEPLGCCCCSASAAASPSLTMFLAVSW